MIRKRQFLVAVLCLLIVAGAYVTNRPNHAGEQSVMNQEEAEASPTPKLYGEAKFVSGEGLDYVAQAKVSREEARAEALDLLREAVSMETEESGQAAETMAQMAKATEQESKLEQELKAKGFGDCVVFITENGVSVTVGTKGLKPEDTAKILSPVMAETGFGTDKIKIIEIK